MLRFFTSNCNYFHNTQSDYRNNAMRVVEGESGQNLVICDIESVMDANEQIKK